MFYKMFNNNYPKLVKIIALNRLLFSEGFQFKSRIFVTKFHLTNSVTTDSSKTPPVNCFMYRCDYLKWNNYLVNNPNYANLIWKNRPVEEISCSGEAFELLKKIDESEVIDEAELKKLPDSLKPALPGLNLPDFFDLLNLFLKNSRKYKKLTVWEQITAVFAAELSNRFSSFSNEEHFRFLYIMLLNKNPVFFDAHWRSIWKLYDRCSKLDLYQTVMLIHVFPATRWKQKDKPFLLESQFFNYLHQYNWSEIGIICFSLLKIKRLLTHIQFVSTLVQKVIDDIDNIDSLSFKYICSMLMKSGNVKEMRHIKYFQEQMIPHVSKFQAPALVYLLSSNLKNHNLNLTLAEKGFKIIKNNLHELYFKEIEQVVHLMGRFLIKDDELINSAVKLYESNLDQIPAHNVADFLSCVIPQNIYPEKLIKAAVTPENIEKLVKEKNIGLINNMIQLYYSLELLKPEYFFDLSDRSRRKMWGLKLFYKSDSTTNRRHYVFNYDLENDLVKLYGKNLSFYDQPLPHYLPVMLIRFNKNLEPQPIPEEYKNDRKKGYLKKAPDDGHYWITFLLVTRPELFLNTNKSNFFLQSKILQYKAAGYIPVRVLASEYYIHKPDSTSYVKELIDEALKELPQCLAQNQLQ